MTSSRGSRGIFATAREHSHGATKARVGRVTTGNGHTLQRVPEGGSEGVRPLAVVVTPLFAYSVGVVHVHLTAQPSL
jgi:hypothetical protein